MRHKFSRITVLMTIAALILGNLVVATKAGDACGTDWPLCNGKLIPDLSNYKILIEYSHRLFTGGLGFIILINSIYAWRKKYVKETAVILLSILSMFLLLLQSLVGGLNVLLGTPPGFTTLDVTISLLLLTSIVALTSALERKKISPLKTEINTNKKLIQPAGFIFLLYFLEVLIGAFFKHSGASNVVNNIILDHTLVESYPLSQFIYYSHGITNMIIFIGACYLWLLSRAYQILTKESFVFFILIIMNGVSGFLTQGLLLNEISSSMHMIIVILTVYQGACLVTKAYFGRYFVTER